MKIRLIKPLVQIGRVIPAGVILSDAPVPLMERLVKTGKAEMLSEASERPSARPEQQGYAEYPKPKEEAQGPSQTPRRSASAKRNGGKET